MQIGIVGLPNVGKSTLFNALTKGRAAASNFPFTTIEPNVGEVAVPDERLEFLTKTYQSAQTIPVTVRFVDIAGLVKGASQGEGLGNQFLSHIREVDAIVEVVRCFENKNITHVSGTIDPQSDIATINTELALADLQQAQKSAQTLREKVKKQDKLAISALADLEQAIALLDNGSPLRTDPELTKRLKSFNLLTSKPLLYLANISEGDRPIWQESVAKLAEREHAAFLAIDAKTEDEIARLSSDEQAEYRQQLSMKAGLPAVIQEGYRLLDLITFFTAGPKESRGWTIRRGTKAPEAAGVIHTDFTKGFIRAEVFHFADLKELGSERVVKEKGRVRSEGKEYVMQDGDIAYFLFNL